MLVDGIKKFKIRKDYISMCKDGIIFGKRNGSGKHLTILQKENRTTIHLTDPKSDDRKNIFNAMSLKEHDAKFEKKFIQLLLRCSVRKRPKWIYAIPNSVLVPKFIMSKNKKEGTLVTATESELLNAIVRMRYSDFVKSDCFVGLTRLGSLVMKGSGISIILSKKSMRKLTREINKIPFFGAISTGKKMLI